MKIQKIIIMQRKTKSTRKKERKKRKEGPKGYPPRLFFFARTRDGPKKLIFHIRIVKRNRNEIETQEKSDFEYPIKKKKREK